MRLRYFWLLFLILLAAPKGFTQSSTPVPAGKVNVTDGAGGYTLQPYSGGGSGSTVVVYASSLSGAHNGQAIAPGSSAASAVDSAAALNTALSAGNVKLVIDSGYALSTSLVMFSGDTIECIGRDAGLIMMVASNLPPIVNAHPNAPTTASGTGGFVVSNQSDSNLDVHGCLINANSTEAVTGTQSGVAHKYNPATGLWVTGPQFIGVVGLNFSNNEVYDAGTYGVMGTNDTNAYINNNYIHFPTPLVSSKNTACVQFVGPDTLLQINFNRVTCGDDSIALNADDGNRTGSGDPNSPFGSWPGTKWGPIVHVHLIGNTFDASYFGMRLLSATELIDDISFVNNTGNLCGNTFTLAAAYPGIGSGNLGTINVDGWNAPTSGTCNIFGFPYNFYITENYQTINLSNVSLTPGVNWPIITHNVNIPGVLNLDHVAVTSTGLSGLSLFSFTGGSAPIISTAGLRWNDNAANTGTAFAGTLTPGILTCSNYAGPNRLLGGSFVPAISNGDCFTNTYPTAAVTYVNTTFNEASSGNLVGSTPATCTNGCTGTWTAAADPPATNWQYTTNSTTLTGGCVGGPFDNYCPVYMNVGHANFTARYNLTSSTNCGFSPVVRWTNASNFVTWQYQIGSSQWELFDVVSGTNNLIATVSGSCPAGTYTLVVNGTSVSMTTPASTVVSGTISGSNTATTMGIGDFKSSSISDVLTSLSVKSF